MKTLVYFLKTLCLVQLPFVIFKILNIWDITWFVTFLPTITMVGLILTTLIVEICIQWINNKFKK